MAKEHNRFIYGNKEDYEQGRAKHLIPGCVGNGIAPEVAEEIWNKMEKFASYAFNRSHAACYAWIASITAYMSCHWAPEFHCAMLNAFDGISNKVKGYLALAVKRGIKILPPDINKSMDKCTVENGCIRLGFRILANLNKFSNAIIKERVHGCFTGYQDFFQRMWDNGSKPNKSVMESLIFSGSLDAFGLNRQQLVNMIPLLETDCKKSASARAMNQICLFSSDQLQIEPPNVPEYHEKTLMDEEYKAIGFYLTHHPVDKAFAAVKGDASYITITDLSELESGQEEIKTFGVIKDLKQLFTRNDDEMYVFSVEDRFTSMRCVLFPKRVPANRHNLLDGAVVKVVGEYTIDDERGPQIIVRDLGKVEEVAAEKSAVTIAVQSREEQNFLLSYIHANPGKTNVRLLANGSIYPIKASIRLTPETLDYLREHFSSVSV